MTLTVDGIYTQGRIELLVPPPGVREGHIRVTLTQEEPAPTSCYLVRGKYKAGRLSTLEDFTDVEWHGEEEFDNQYGG